MKSRSALGVLALAAFISCLWFAPALAADQLRQAKDAYQRGDYATALRLFRPLAEKGNAEARYALGFMYEQGQGAPRDYREAAKWFRESAAQGYAYAQSRLGVMYAEGQGLTQDFGESVKWFQLAAEQGFNEARYNLGVAFAKGQGVAKDFVKAHMWFSLAAASETDAADRDRANKGRDIVAGLMTPAEIAEARRLAAEWKPKSAGGTRK